MLTWTAWSQEFEYVATQVGNLKAHKLEGVRYPYKQCDYAATTAGTLKAC